MTEELEKEAEEWIKDHSGLIGGYKFVKYDYDSMQKAYLAGAEPREKQIQIDVEQIRALQKQNGELTDTVKELKAQIEKMKCCGNCKNEGDYKEPYRYGTGWCNICKRHKVAKGNFDKWEIKEND